MSKVSSKLAAGVRKVREQQIAAPVAGKRAVPNAGGRRLPGERNETPVVENVRADPGRNFHPTRVWPD